MELPNRSQAVVPREKVVDYLLSTTHPTGRHKAAFFGRFGFGVENWELLVDALLRHVQENDVARQENSPFGIRYVVEGIMVMADGRDALMRTVWFIDTDNDTPRLVTAYPF